ncbi:MAG: MCE family protein [Ferruginibacter sp.]|nr:MCE family protein [Ferruginibacter sp.]
MKIIRIMIKKSVANNIKLGAFVIASLIFLIMIFYMIGKNKHLFGANFTVKARFENVQGLKIGNNVRFGGIDIGTVKKIEIINDTLMEVVMTVDHKLKKILRKNAIASIGTDGLVGNKVINIEANRLPDHAAEENDILLTQKSVNTDEMMRTLDRTNNDVNIVAENLKIITQKINKSQGLWDLITNRKIAIHFNKTAENIEKASMEANKIGVNTNQIIRKISNGRGILGKMISDTLLYSNFNQTIVNFKKAGIRTDSFLLKAENMINNIESEINYGKGPIHALLVDSSNTLLFKKSMLNIEKGTEGFNEIIDAMKHHFLFRRYFKRIENEKIKSGNP